MPCSKIPLLGLICIFLLSIQTQAQAQESVAAVAEKSPWSHESELSIVQVGGNTKSETSSAKQKTEYQSGLNSYKAVARYLQSKSAGLETAKSWEASLRYERELSSLWSVFLQQGAESDISAGYVQRDNFDLGGKYFFIKTDPELFFTELGVRSTRTNPQGATPPSENTSGRLYLEYGKKISESLSAKLWLEYLPNFKDSEAWLANAEPSLSVMLSRIFSLKISYLLKHQAKVPVGRERNDTTLTTALVAKF